VSRWSQTDEGRRIAVGLVIAMHDRDDRAFHVLLEGVPRAALISVLETVAEMADAAVRRQMETPEEAREALTLFARQLVFGE